MLLIYAVMGGIAIFAVFAIFGVSSETTTTTTNDEIDTAVFGGFILVLGILGILSILYEVGFIAIKGATPGKMLMKVQVVRLADGQVPGWGPSFMRWVLNLITIIPYLGSCVLLVANIWGLVNLFNHPMRQTPFDMIAKTVVIDKR